MAEQEFNDGHIIEGLDRCNTIQVMIHELLDEHPAVKKAEVQSLIDEASGLIGEAYQIIGQLEES